MLEALERSKEDQIAVHEKFLVNIEKTTIQQGKKLLADIGEG